MSGTNQQGVEEGGGGDVVKAKVVGEWVAACELLMDRVIIDAVRVWATFSQRYSNDLLIDFDRYVSGSK